MTSAYPTVILALGSDARGPTNAEHLEHLWDVPVRWPVSEAPIPSAHVAYSLLSLLEMCITSDIHRSVYIGIVGLVQRFQPRGIRLLQAENRTSACRWTVRQVHR